MWCLPLFYWRLALFSPVHKRSEIMRMSGAKRKAGITPALTLHTAEATFSSSPLLLSTVPSS
jgi:hypothetical protein